MSRLEIPADLLPLSVWKLHAQEANIGALKTVSFSACFFKFIFYFLHK